MTYASPNHPRPSSAILGALLASALLVGLTATPATATPSPTVMTASPGAPGLGDRLVPGLGNGGYDVAHYDLTLRYATSDPAQAIDGDETILARATQGLSRFNLDFAGGPIDSISVNGLRARFHRDGEELIVNPSKPLPAGELFVVTISNFVAVPTPIGPDDSSTALFITPDGSATAAQPYYAHFIFPCNDHPRDKATFSFTFDVPAGLDAVANGVVTGHRTRLGRTIWKYAMNQPMATELIQLAVGDWDLSTPLTHHGVLLRDVTAPSITGQTNSALAQQPGQLDFMRARVGHYPFASFGSLVLDEDVGFALETQTISLLDINLFNGLGPDVFDALMLHELSHMWFGDSVSPYEWSDIWLNEGHATWYEFLYSESKGFLTADTTDYPDANGYATLAGIMRAVYAHGDQWRHDYGPVALPLSGDLDNLFSYNAYHGGALVLYALRQQIGKAAFALVEREWVHQYEGKSASTDDFIALASQVSGQDLTAFLGAWVYGETTPPMPGHPNWTVDPVVVTVRGSAADYGPLMRERRAVSNTAEIQPTH